VSDGELVQGLFPVPPVRHELVHQSDKARIMGRLEQVNHLVQDEVLEAFRRLLAQLGV
jgi:hypothetical protein